VVANAEDAARGKIRSAIPKRFRPLRGKTANKLMKSLISSIFRKRGTPALGVAVFLTYQCRKKPTSLSMRIHRKGLDPMAAAMPMRVSIPLPIPVEGMLTTDFPLLFPKNDATAAFHSYRSDRLPCRAQPQVVVLSPPEF